MLLETMKEIGKYVNRHPNTVRTWQKLHGFPVSKLPNGQYVTSTQLIDSWILARQKTQTAPASTGEITPASIQGTT